MKEKYRSESFVALEIELDDLPKATEAEAYRYAPVLGKVIDILTDESRGRITFGAAFDEAKRTTGIDVPLAMEAHIMKLAFQIIATKKIPGAPEA